MWTLFSWATASKMAWFAVKCANLMYGDMSWRSWNAVRVSMGGVCALAVPFSREWRAWLKCAARRSMLVPWVGDTNSLSRTNIARARSWLSVPELRASAAAMRRCSRRRPLSSPPVESDSDSSAAL